MDTLFFLIEVIMNLYQIDNLYKTYGEKTLFDYISLSVDSEDKIGLIGINGTGKSTLLKIIAGIEAPDKGEVMKNSRLKIEFLSQNPEIDEEATVIQQIFKGDSPLVKLLGEYEEALAKLEGNPENQNYQSKLLELSQKMDINNAWQLESEAKKILTKLKIVDFDKKMGELSGGQRKRVAMAGALIRPSDLLILDEPTNHIDNDTIDYLEEHLKTIKTAVLMVTHDRYFLDRVTNTVLELENGKLYKYKGNYSKYLEIKEQRIQDDNKIEDKKKKLYKQELEWIRKGVEARRTKQKARKERFEVLEGEIDRSIDTELDIDVASTRLGRKIIQAQGISFGYKDKSLIQEFDYTVERRDRIGIVGNNGMGKTTLLNLLSGRIIPDTGIIEFGDTIKIGYYTQENLEMNEELKVIDYIKESAEFIMKKDGSKISASSMLENFLFTPSAQHTFIRKLSGGEKRRLYLLKILMESPNVLFLDEPTNDLDIETLGILEDYIASFDGPVITVSHDRYFLDKICNKIFHFKQDGKIVYTMGGYQDYIEELIQEDEEKVEKKSKEIIPEKSNKKIKLSFNEQREYNSIPEEIEKLDNKLQELHQEISKGGSDFGKLSALMKEQEEVEEKLLEKMERLEYLQEILDQMN